MRVGPPEEHETGLVAGEAAGDLRRGQLARLDELHGLLDRVDALCARVPHESKRSVLWEREAGSRGAYDLSVVLRGGEVAEGILCGDRERELDGVDILPGVTGIDLGTGLYVQITTAAAIHDDDHDARVVNASSVHARMGQGRRWMDGWMGWMMGR